MANNTERIEKFLLGDMSPEETEVFKKELQGNADLQDELMIQKNIINAVKMSVQKDGFKRAIKKYKALKLVYTIAGALAGIAALVGLVWVFNSHRNTSKAFSEPLAEYAIITHADTTFKTAEGLILHIPANTFEADTVQLEIKSALKASSIVAQGLSTSSNDAMLSTAGMFYIQARAHDSIVKPIKAIEVAVVAKEIRANMMLFEGEATADGRVNWKNPKKIARALELVPISSLNFYPPKFLPAVHALGFDSSNKKVCDSLYGMFSAFNFGEGGSDWYVGHTNEIKLKPAYVLSIWDTAFKNTLFATKAFEERLLYMHSICGGSAPEQLLGLYLENLDKNLHEIDEMCAAISLGDVKKKFKAFAQQRWGKANYISPAEKEGLLALLEKRFNYWSHWATTVRDSFYEQRVARYNKVSEERIKYIKMQWERESAALQSEFEFNLKTVNEQLDKRPEPVIYGDAYQVEIITLGWKNIDAYVMEATNARDNLLYTDTATGKTVKITYEEVSVKIANAKDFDKLLVYALPNEINSFLIMENINDLYKAKLNAFFNYDILALGYKNGQAFIAQRTQIKSGSLVLELKEISEKQLQELLLPYDRRATSMGITAEVQYQKREFEIVAIEKSIDRDETIFFTLSKTISNCSRKMDARDTSKIEYEEITDSSRVK